MCLFTGQELGWQHFGLPQYGAFIDWCHTGTSRDLPHENAETLFWLFCWRTQVPLVSYSWRLPSQDWRRG